MLSYRHAFHAGNFADVLKHFTLVQVLAYLKQKDKPLCYLETHAGPGIYALEGDFAQKKREFADGIGRLWQREDLPAELLDYVKLIKDFNGSGKLHRYPGSPRIAQLLLCPHDRLILCELHPTDIQPLQKTAQRDSRLTVCQSDGLKHIPGQLPPRERRGLILIDPSYELKNDYRAVPSALIAMHKRFATGTYLLWYPVIERRQADSLARIIQKSGIKNIQRYELAIQADAPGHGMTASGLIVINPPWTLAATMQTTLPWLANVLGNDGSGAFIIETLVGE